MLTSKQVEKAATPYDRDPYADSGKLDAWRAYKGNRALASVWRKGGLAAIAGTPLSAVPYADRRTDRGAVTYSRAFIKAWCEGWHHARWDGESPCREPYHDGVCEAH